MSDAAELQRQLDAARAELQAFVYTVSHDLRAPLRHINAYAQVIEEDWPDAPAEMRSHLATIRSAAGLLSRQLDGLTQLSRIAQQPVQLQAVNLTALVGEVVNELMQHTPERQVQWQLAPDLPAVFADPDLLRQVLTQVLDNALKFSRASSPARIDVSWRALPNQAESADQVELRVQDKGVGFDAQQADQLFKVFGRLHPAREFEGLGLGLLLCRKWLARMDGVIRIEGALNGGCCVVITLPVAG